MCLLMFSYPKLVLVYVSSEIRHILELNHKSTIRDRVKNGHCLHLLKAFILGENLIIYIFTIYPAVKEAFISICVKETKKLKILHSFLLQNY